MRTDDKPVEQMTIAQLPQEVKVYQLYDFAIGFLLGALIVGVVAIGVVIKEWRK